MERKPSTFLPSIGQFLFLVVFLVLTFSPAGKNMLADADTDLYGYEIARKLTSDEAPTAPFKQGALYPVLRNMSGAGLLSSRVVPSYSGPPRRYYRITPLGREVLAAWRETWLGTRAFVDTIVQHSTSAAQEMPS